MGLGVSDLLAGVDRVRRLSGSIAAWFLDFPTPRANLRIHLVYARYHRCVGIHLLAEGRATTLALGRLKVLLTLLSCCQPITAPRMGLPSAGVVQW